MNELSSGCAFIEVEREGDDKESLFLPVWKGNRCVNLMVCKEDTHELLYRIFNIETSAKDNSKDNTQKKEETPSTEANDEKQ